MIIYIHYHLPDIYILGEEKVENNNKAPDGCLSVECYTLSFRCEVILVSFKQQSN